MEKSALIKLAKKGMDIISEENGFSTYSTDTTLGISFPSGKCFELSDSEIKFRAIDYLQSQLTDIKESF